jgi:glycosyltransferase involved in cell wall biosynthesis
MFFRVAREAKLQNLPLHFIVVGTGEMKDKLAELALSLKVQDRVHFIGIRNDIPEILRASDIFLFTSLYEGFPNALLEAMAARLPVVTTNFNGVDELVENGFNGIVVPINDVNAAFTALKFYIDNPQKARQFAAAARMSVEQRFPMEKMVDETLQFYRNLISRNSSVDR